VSAPFQELREAVDRHINTVMAACPYPASLYDPIRYVMGIGGKRVRPLLVVLSARSLGRPAQSVLDVAVAVELLHNFTLVHDDIMDRDSMRRGHPTIHARWDEGTAILAGDALIGIAYRCLSQLETPRIGELIRTFTDAVVEVCEGQALDKEFEGRRDVSLADYEDMIARKTGRLLSMSARIGALAADAPAEVADGLEAFGDRLGAAFQIQDDLLDYLSTTEELGKTVGSDLAMRKATYVTLKARERLSGAAARRLDELLALSGAEAVGELRALLVDGGVLKAGRERVDELVEEALGHLRRVLPEGADRELAVFADWILNRRY
jgi:geranylgeranyl diphosphate synthase, type II